MSQSLDETTKEAIRHLKSQGYAVLERIPNISEMNDETLQQWRIKIIAWGVDLRHEQQHAMSQINQEIERRDLAPQGVVG